MEVKPRGIRGGIRDECDPKTLYVYIKLKNTKAVFLQVKLTKKWPWPSILGLLQEVRVQTVVLSLFSHA